MKDHLTDKEIRAAELMGITEAEMLERLVKFESGAYRTAIVIPVYNGEKFIKECVMSALNQTDKDIEVIVVDDGSTDNTLKILYEIPKITVLVQPNGGTASALNTAIRNTKGTWVHWLSADDVLYPTAIEDMMDTINRTEDNTKYIYYSDYDIIDENSSIIGEFIEPIERNYRNEADRFNELLCNYYGNGSSSMVHRSVFEKIKYDETLAHSEDYDFMLHAMTEGYDMKLVPSKTLKYRRHPGQLTNTVGGSLSEFIRGRYR